MPRQYAPDLRPATTDVAGFHRIVVAVGSGPEHPAIDLALTLAAPDAVLMLARVHAPDAGRGQSAREHADLAGVTEAMSVLRSARATLDRPCELVAEPAATPVVGLHRIVEDEQADLLVLGPHRDLAGVHQVLPAVLRGAPCAVAVVGRASLVTRESLGTVAFAHAPTATGREGARIAGSLAASRGAELHGIHVVPVEPTRWTGRAGEALHSLQRATGTLAEQAEDDIRALHPQAIAHVAEGDQIEGLVAYARGVDLLVVGARGAGPMRRLITGSTTEALSTRCPSALLITPPPAADPASPAAV